MTETSEKKCPVDLFRSKITIEPKLKRVKIEERKQQILPGLQVGKQLALF